MNHAHRSLGEPILTVATWTAFALIGVLAAVVFVGIRIDWQAISVVAGVGAIVLIGWAIVRDTAALVADRELPDPSAFDRPLYMVALAALVALWLGAAWLR